MRVRRTLVRPCPKCLPDKDADFKLTRESALHGQGEYACINCGHEIIVKRHPVKAGGPAQESALARIRKIAGKREVVVKPATGGAVSVMIRPGGRDDETVMVFVGARGGLEQCEILSQPSQAQEIKHGRHAWTRLEVYGKG